MMDGLEGPLLPPKLETILRRLIWLEAPKAPRLQPDTLYLILLDCFKGG